MILGRILHEGWYFWWVNNSPVGQNRLREIGRIFSIEIRNMKLWKMPKLLNFTFPEGWFFFIVTMLNWKDPPNSIFGVKFKNIFHHFFLTMLANCYALLPICIHSISKAHVHSWPTLIHPTLHPSLLRGAPPLNSTPLSAGTRAVGDLYRSTWQFRSPIHSDPDAISARWVYFCLHRFWLKSGPLSSRISCFD